MQNSNSKAETTADKSGADDNTTSSHSSANTFVGRGLSAQEALSISRENVVIEIEKGYESIKSQIENAALRGKYEIYFLPHQLPPTDTFERLKKEGYMWYWNGGLFNPMPVYTLSWKPIKEGKTKKAIKKLFGVK